MYGKRADLIQWFRFLQCVAQPYTIPTSQDLLAALDSFKTLPKNTDQWIQQPLWFNEEDIRERIIKQVTHESPDITIYGHVKEACHYESIVHTKCTTSITLKFDIQCM